MSAKHPAEPADTRGGRHAPALARTLILLAVATGIVDAVSYLGLGKVFVANMTGNVVFLGFALAGDSELSFTASLVAIAAFLVGAVLGGRLGGLLVAHKGRLLAAGVSSTLTLIAVALVIALAGAVPPSEGLRYTLIVVLALGMGVQNAISRRLLSGAATNVLTTMLTGLAADSRLAGGANAHAVRRAATVVAMFTGALLGGLLVHHVDLRAGLALAASVMAGVVAWVWRRARRTPALEWES